MEQCVLQRIHSFDECRDFVWGFYGDPVFSDPMLANEEQLKCNLLKAMDEPEHHAVLGVFRNSQLTGLFAFLILKEERYLEMLVGLSRDQEAYAAVFRYLQQHYSSYDADFVFNPNHALLRGILREKGAAFETEQQKMVLAHPVSAGDTDGVELLTEQYKEQYFAMHNTDLYWTGEKVAAAAEKFRVYLAIHDGVVVGYLDVTCCFEENEPFDLLVREEYRRRGYGRKLLARAVEMNKPNGMMLLVDVDNHAAIRLYESMGFEKAENQNSLTAHWKI